MRKALLCLFVLGLSSTLFAQRVSRSQNGEYPTCYVSIRDYSATPSGLLFIDYNFFIFSDAYFDENGDKVNPTKGNENFNVSGYLNLPLIDYTSKFELLGGAKYFVYIAPNYVTGHANLYLSSNDNSPVAEGNGSGFGDLTVMPFGLSWSFKEKSDISFLYTIYAPTGRYEVGASDNIGLGHWANMFQVPVYYYLNDQATAFGLIPSYEINSKIKGTDVRPGSRLTLEYGVSQFITNWLEFEVMNGHSMQLSDDTGSDVWWDGSVKDSKNSFSVGVGFFLASGQIDIQLEYGRDYGLKDRFRTEFIGLSFLYMPGVLAVSSDGN